MGGKRSWGRCGAVGMAATLTSVLLGGVAWADSELPAPTPGVQSVQSGGDTYFYLPVDGGKRWFPFCPRDASSSDVCGGTGKGGGRVFLADPNDSRCQVVGAHNDKVHPSDVVLPKQCFDYPLLFVVRDKRALRQTTADLQDRIGSCVNGGQQGDMVCDNPLSHWPRQSPSGPLDCGHIPPAQLPPAVQDFTNDGHDQQRMAEVCAVLDTYLTETPPADSAVPPTEAAQAIGKTAFDLAAITAGHTDPDNVLDLGILQIDLTHACQSGSSVACALDSATNAVDCASDPTGCLTQWAVRGAVSSVKLLGNTLSAAPAVDLSGPAFRGAYQPVGVLSAFVVLLLLLLSGITALVRASVGEIGHALLGVVRWIVGVVASLSLTVLALSLAQTISTWFVGDGQTFQDLTSRFTSIVQQAFTLDDAAGAAAGALLFVLALLMLLAAFVTFLVMLGRAAAIVLVLVFSPLMLAGEAGPDWARRWSGRGLRMLGALIFAQPIAAIFYRVGVSYMSQGQGLTQLGFGFIVMLLVGISPWLLLSFIGLTESTTSHSRMRSRVTSSGGLTSAALLHSTMRNNAPAATPAGAAGGAGGGASVGSRLAGGTAAAAGGMMAAAAVGKELLGAAANTILSGGGALGEGPEAPHPREAARLAGVGAGGGHRPLSAAPLSQAGAPADPSAQGGSGGPGPGPASDPRYDAGHRMPMPMPPNQPQPMPPPGGANGGSQ